MYQHYKCFDELHDEAILWRYLDLPRYLDLLLKQQLFFCRADRFEDPFEGMNSANTSLSPQESNGSELYSKENSIQKEQVTINSWHLNDKENYAMWKIYANGSYGLAIQTTFRKLRESFSSCDKAVYIGKVVYYDDDAIRQPIEDPILPFFRKRSIYQYENEVRCCYKIPAGQTEFTWQEQGDDNGVFIASEVNSLIERIYISPYSPKWLEEIIQGINAKFDLSKEIIHSAVFEAN